MNMRILNGKRILIISTEPWNHDFLSKHHLAIALTRLGNTVYFLNPPSVENGCAAIGQYPGLFLVNYKPLLRGIHFLPQPLDHWFSRKDAIHILELVAGDLDIVWSFDPFRFQDLGLFNARWSIYHVADAHPAKYENLLADSARIILGPSNQLLEKFDKAKSHCIGHMVDEDFVNRVGAASAGTNERIQIGYVGNLLSHFLDYPLLVRTVVQNPQCDFTFIGDHRKIDRNHSWQQLGKLDHVHFAGPLSHNDMANQLSQFDVFLCCYDTEKFFREASNSHKLLEYLATGKPVISTRIAYYLDKDGVLYMPSSNAELPDLVKKITSALPQYNSPAEIARRIRFVKEHTYARVLSRIDELLLPTP
jgi:glycosyltransferase involved in cell wall biosynthesis